MTSPSRALRASLLAFALASLGAVASAQTPTHERLTRIAHDYIDAIAGEDPITATALGLPGADGKPWRVFLNLQPGAQPIDAAAIRPATAAPSVTEPATPFRLDDAERLMIVAALKEHRHNISRAAAALGISRGTLYRRMAQHGL